MTWRSVRRGVLALPLLWLGSTGCPGDDGGEETTASKSSSGTSMGSTSTASATGSTGTATTSVPTGGADATGPTTSEGTTTVTTSPTDGSTTSAETDGGACSMLGPRECMADEACMPIAGAPIIMTDGGFCVGPREFIECQPAMGCGDAITYACETEDSMMWEFLDTCVPAGWVSCGEPPPGLMPCP